MADQVQQITVQRIIGPMNAAAQGDRERPVTLSRNPMLIEFPEHTAPVASVIIPVHGQWTVTQDCLQSLSRLHSSTPFEVVVVDDCSPDDTADELAAIPGLRHVRTGRNTGFVGACNLGAEHARGSVLVFLNNDTLVHHRWLDVLVETLDQDPTIGLVGSLLMYPDGLVQESGGIIFQDGSGHNFGRRWWPENSAIRGTRDVDYCSGASIAVRRALFEELGGFDIRYAPAYYEDVDLCFGIRGLGYRVVVQPESVLTHLEGVSNGRDDTGGLKRFQRVNRAAFLRKWRKELVVNGPNDGPASVWNGRHRRPRGMVLIYESDVPTPDQDAGSRRLKAIIDELRGLGFAVYLAPAERRGLQPYTRDLEREGVTVLTTLEEQHGFLIEAGPAISTIILSRPQVAGAVMEQVLQYAPDALTIYDSVDLHGRRLLAQSEIENDPRLRRMAGYIWELERTAMKITDITLVVSPVEKEYLAGREPGVQVELLSLVHQAVVTDPRPTGRRDIVMVGNYNHPPNIDGAQWMSREVMPLIRKVVPDATLNLVGSNLGPAVAALAGPGVEVVGWVKDLAPVYAAARVVVAPLRFGAGVKGKVAEAVEHGLPIVGTSVAFEGMPVIGGTDVAVGDTPEAFAAAVIKLLQDDDQWVSMAASGQRRILEAFSPKQARTVLERILNDVPGWTRAG